MRKNSAHDLPISPNSFGEFIGQERIKQRIQFAVNAARHRGEPLGHVLLVGPPGCGKGTLARVIFNVADANFKVVSGRAGGSSSDFAGLLASIDANDFVFIEDVDALGKATSEFLSKPMKDFKFDIWIDKGPNARPVLLNLPRFTLIGSTTSSTRLPPAFKSSFEIVEEFTSYSKEELAKIARRFAKRMNFTIDKDGAMQIASGACESPAEVLNKIRHLRDYIYNNSIAKRVNAEVVGDAMKMLTTTATNSTRHRTRRKVDFTGDPLKRRYQVFVSSTYEDLKEERRHMMQALLETKCIPTGMEFFPAANEEQWELIKRVIDDCDYYIVVVAGRYGSVGSKGISYTEMEFDYALASGKSVIGFYYADTNNLVGSKLEKTMTGRKKLITFTQKVKNRICKSWSSPEGLASATKSAILNAIENDRKPGWIRAVDLPTTAAIEDLKESVQYDKKVL